jgi:hypothetical protein
MRIFLSCQQALKSHAVPAYAFWEFYFRNALLEAGHEIVEAKEVDWAEGLTALSKADRAEWLERTWTRTVEFVTSLHGSSRIDLFLSYLFPYQVEPSAVRAVRALGIPCVNFFCDNVREFERVPASFADFDLHWVPEAEARPLYAATGLSFIYAPMPMWVRPDLRSLPEKEAGDAVFIGSHDDLREELLGEAVELGLPLRLMGAGWKGGGPGGVDSPRTFLRTAVNQAEFLRTEGIRGWVMRATYRFRKRRSPEWIERHLLPPIHGDDYFKALRESRVAVGINRYPSFRRPFSNPRRYSRLRDIEAPMVGACLLTEAAPGLEDLYEIGAEIETFRDAGELVEKTALLLADPARRLSLRQKGQRRALRDHTIARSLERIMQRLGLAP